MNDEIFGNYNVMTGLQEPTFEQEWLQLECDMDEERIDPMSAYVKLYEIKRQVDDVMKRVKEKALEARQKYDRKEIVEKGGFEIQLASRKSYSFDHDDEYNSKKAELKERESLMKKAAAMAEQNKDLIVHGEIIEPALVGETEYIKMKRVK